MTVSIPLCVSSRETVSSHGPPSSPYFARTAPGSMPGRKCEGVVPSGTTRTSRASARRRSEEHTSELQSLAYLVCRLLLEKKKQKINKVSQHVDLHTLAS